MHSINAVQKTSTPVEAPELPSGQLGSVSTGEDVKKLLKDKKLDLQQSSFSNIVLMWRSRKR